MTDQQLAAAPIRRGSVVWCGRGSWLVWNVSAHTLRALPFRRGDRSRHAGDVSIDALADQLLARVKAVPVVKAGSPNELRRDSVEYAGELSGPAQCRVSVAVARLAAESVQIDRWSADKRHRRRAYAEKSAL